MTASTLQNTFHRFSDSPRMLLADLVFPLKQANCLQEAESIEQAIKALDSRDMSPSQALKLLQHLNQSVEEKISEHRGQVISAKDGTLQSLHAGHKTQCLENLLAEIHVSLCLQSSEQERVIDYHLLATSLHMGMSHYRQQILWLLQLYQPVPNGVWNQLHGVYGLAKELGVLHHKHITDVKADTLSIIDTYKCVLLLDAANTSRFRATEILTLDYLLSSWVAAVKLSAPGNRADLYAVFIDKDQGANYQGLIKDKVRNPYTWFSLDLTDVVEVLQELLPEAAKSLHSSVYYDGVAIQRSFIEQLLITWIAKPVRRFPRRERHSAVNVHYSPDEPEKSADAENWQMVNVSANGCCLVKKDANGTGLKVGQMIRLQVTGEANWDLGFIRWMRFNEEGELLIGIQKPSRFASTVTLKQGQEQVKGYLLPHYDDAVDKNVLVVPAEVGKIGAKLQLVTDNRVYWVELAGCLQNDEEYGHYSFNAVASY